MTALIWASEGGHTPTVQHLLEAGADKEAKDKVRDERERGRHRRMVETEWLGMSVWNKPQTLSILEVLHVR